MSWTHDDSNRLATGSRTPGGGDGALEASVAVILWAWSFLLVVALVIGRSVGAALFLNSFDALGLAIVYAVVGASAPVIATIVDRFGRAHGRLRAALVVQASLFAIVLAGGKWLTGEPSAIDEWALGLFHVSIECLTFVATVQFWSTANETLPLARARRIYVFVGTGGIVGGIAGGALTSWLAAGSLCWALYAMALVVAMQSVALAAFAASLGRLRQRDPKASDRWNLDEAADSVGLSIASAERTAGLAEQPTPPRSLAMRFGVVSLLMVFATTLVDFRYKTAADLSHPGDVGGLASFFGGFHLWVGLATLLAQLVLTPLLVRAASAHAGLMSSPVALFVAALVDAHRPGLGSVVALKLTDGALTHSVYRSCQEMLYTPLPTRWVHTLRTRSDGLWGRVGLIGAGAFLALLSMVPATSARWLLALATFASLFGWTVAIALLRRGYKDRANGAALERETARRSEPIPDRRWAA